MMKINPWEQTVLLLPQDTQTGLGIAQNGVYIYPISKCHAQSFDKNKDASGQARCNADGCRNASSVLTTFATSCRVTESGEGLMFFLEVWTGLTAEAFTLTVDNN